MSKYDKEFQSNTAEYEKAVEPPEKDAERKHEPRDDEAPQQGPLIGPDDETVRLPR